MTHSLEKIPTSFKEDQTGREDFAQNLIHYLTTSRHSVDGSFVVTLHGAYGSGKSIFLDLLSSKLKVDEHIFKKASKTRIIRINAWEGDFIGDPVLQLVTEIYNTLVSSEDQNTQSRFKKLTSTLINTTRSALKGYAKEKFGDEAIEQIMGVLESYKNTDNDSLFDKAITGYNKQKKQISDLSKLLSEICDHGNNPILIIVDELDRCKPDYAVHFLETLKHLFNAKGVVFLLSADLNSLESTVKCMFGEKINFKEYYRKFSHNTVNLPHPNSRSNGYFFKQQLLTYLSDHLSKIESNNDRHNYFQTISNSTSNLINLEKYTLRQIHHFLRVFSFSLTNRKTSNPYTQIEEHISVINLLCLLYVIDHALYKEFTREVIDVPAIVKGITASPTRPSNQNESEAYAYLIGSLYPTNEQPPLNFHNLFPSAHRDKCVEIMKSVYSRKVLDTILPSIDFYSSIE